ncbi:MAG: hypothetical protein HRT38_05205, partial [Alteromonadaceae bacterium]|nr:hypothetical protein [Alteromonadaceae bacterium]
MEEIANQTSVNQKLTLLGSILIGLVSVNILTSTLTSNVIVIPEQFSNHQTKKDVALQYVADFKCDNIVKSSVFWLNSDSVETVKSINTTRSVLIYQNQNSIEVTASSNTREHSTYST